MKKLLAVLLLMSFAGFAFSPSGSIRLLWDWDDSIQVDSFRLITAPTINTPLANWTTVTNVHGSNRFVDITVIPGQHFFALYASNFWGESKPLDNVTNTPPLPTNSFPLKVQRNP